MGRAVGERDARAHHAAKDELRPDRARRAGRPAAALRRRALRGRRRRGRDQPARRRPRQPAAGRGRRPARRSWWATSTAAACSRRSTAPSPCCRRSWPCSCAASSSTASGATPRCSATPPASSSAAAACPPSGVVPDGPGIDLDAEDSLALDRWSTARGPDAQLDVAAIRFPRVANFGDLDPLRLEPGVAVRWVTSAAALGRARPRGAARLQGHARATWTGCVRGDSTRRSSGPARPVLAICAGAQMVGDVIDDPDGVEGPPGHGPGLGWLPLRTTFAADKVLDRPAVTAVGGPGAGAARGRLPDPPRPRRRRRGRVARRRRRRRRRLARRPGAGHDPARPARARRAAVRRPRLGRRRVGPSGPRAVEPGLRRRPDRPLRRHGRRPGGPPRPRPPVRAHRRGRRPAEVPA